MIIVLTGNGKGKTTAALGQALRAIGAEKKVLMIQFIKSPVMETGELIAAKRLGPDFKIAPMGRGFVGILHDMLPREEHCKAATEALSYAKEEERSGAWDILILDEINVALDLELIQIKTVIEFLNTIGENKEIILTGRNAPAEILERADLVSEINDIKHPFAKGQRAKRGVEY